MNKRDIRLISKSGFEADFVREANKDAIRWSCCWGYQWWVALGQEIGGYHCQDSEGFTIKEESDEEELRLDI